MAVGKVTSDELYKWRGILEQCAGEIVTGDEKEVSKASNRLDKLSDEIFERYLDVLGTESRERKAAE